MIKNMKTQSTNKMWVWLAIVVVVVAVGYFYYSGTSSSPSGANLVESSADQSVGAQVLALLNQIQSLNIDTTLFTDPGYQTLRDYSVAIPAVNVGRANPFAPLPGVSVVPTATH